MTDRLAPGWGGMPGPVSEEEQFLRGVRRAAHEASVAGLTFGQTLEQSDRAMVAKAVDYAWQAFKDAIAVLPRPEPTRWVAHVLASDWVTLPLEERAHLGARPLVGSTGDVVLVEGVGQPPAIIERWAYVR